MHLIWTNTYSECLWNGAACFDHKISHILPEMFCGSGSFLEWELKKWAVWIHLSQHTFVKIILHWHACTPHLLITVCFHYDTFFVNPNDPRCFISALVNFCCDICSLFHWFLVVKIVIVCSTVLDACLYFVKWLLSDWFDYHNRGTGCMNVLFLFLLKFVVQLIPFRLWLYKTFSNDESSFIKRL